MTITEQTYASAVINFSVNLKSGKYGFRLYDDRFGWFATTERTVLSVSQRGTYTVSPTTSSFNGGVVTVTANHIGDGSIVKVNNMVGRLIERTDTNAKFEIPRLVTVDTQTKFKFAKNVTIPLQGRKTWGDS